MSDSFEDNEAELVTQLAAIIFQNDPDCLSSLRQALGDWQAFCKSEDAAVDLLPKASPSAWEKLIVVGILHHRIFEAALDIRLHDLFDGLKTIAPAALADCPWDCLGDESKEYDREMYLESISCKLHFAGHGIVLLYKYSETLPIVVLHLADIERLLEAAAELTQGEVVSLGD
ncbi:MAG: hypothetical protein ACK5A1_08695 [Planctomyces sp.]